MGRPFQIKLSGNFYSFHLYTEKGGKEIFDLDEACQEAEEQYGEEWVETYNGVTGMSRDDFKQGELQ